MLLNWKDLAEVVVAFAEDADTLAPEPAFLVVRVEGSLGNVCVEGGATAERFFLSGGAVEVACEGGVSACHRRSQGSRSIAEPPPGLYALAL